MATVNNIVANLGARKGFQVGNNGGMARKAPPPDNPTGLYFARESAGMSQDRLSELSGVAKGQISKLEGGKRKFTREWAERFAGHLPYSAEEILFWDQKNSIRAPAAVEAGAPLSPRPPIQVFGWVSGQKNADFLIRDDIQGEREELPRPSGIPASMNVYALRVTNESMEPRYHAGDVLYVQAYKTPRPGEDAVIQLSQGPHDQERSGYVKTFVRKTSRKWICEQYNPRKTVEFDVGDVISIERVIPWKELLG